MLDGSGLGRYPVQGSAAGIGLGNVANAYENIEMPSTRNQPVAAKAQSADFPSAKSRGKSVDPYADGMSRKVMTANKMWSMQSPHVNRVHIDPAKS